MSSVDGGPSWQESIERIAEVLFTEKTRNESLDEIAGLAHAAIPACIAVSITMGDRRAPYTAVSSSELASVVDEHQYEEREGPCLDAVRLGEVVSVESVDDEMRWPGFMRHVRGTAIKTILSLPLSAGGDAVGAMNTYGDRPAGLLERREAAESFAKVAGVAVANAVAYHRATELNTQLTEALEHRDVIGQAKGMLMASTGITASEAFQRLREQSQHSNRKLYDIAREMANPSGVGV